MAYQRSIDIAYDKQTGEQYDAHTLFNTAKEGHEIRRRYNAGELEINCCKCDQALIVSDSKRDHLHFKHFPNAKKCPLKDGGMTTEEVKEYNDILRARESSRHKFLKNRIAQLLTETEGVEAGSVVADTRFFFSDLEKRRPDVYGVYKGKKMAFEIQLSNLSQRYLLGRHNFYKGKGIYLVWILDNFDVQGQSKMERDIKYLTPSQNFFKLDESVDDFRLSCTYKSPFITKEKTILSPWRTRSVSLAEVQFSGREYQVYYLNYEHKLKEAEKELEQKIEREAEEEREERRRLNRVAAEQGAEVVVKKIKDYRNKKWDFYKFHEDIDKLSFMALDVLNERFGFDTRRPKGVTLLNYYIANAKDGEHSFIKFLLGEKRINIDVNAVDDGGATPFQQILWNRNLDYRQPLIKNLFKRGYKLTDEDIAEHGKLDMHEGDKAQELMALKWCDQLETKELVDDVYQNLTFLFSVESARRKEIFGFGYKNWISFAVQAMIKHRDNWIYIERAFRRYGLWDILIANDKHKNFQKQVAKITEEQPEQDLSRTYLLMRELYRDIA